MKINLHELNNSTLESLKEVRTNLLYGNCKIIGITSISPSEGKTSLTLQLAKQFALLNKRILVIEADMKKPSMHKRLLIRRQDGLSEFLSGQREDVIIQTDENFDIVFSGKTPPNSSELLSSEKFKNTLLELSKKYDYILIDTPPVSGAIDAQIIGGLVDGMVFIIRTKFTRVDDLKKVLNTFKNGNINVIGAILNRIERGSKNHYYYYSYYGEKTK